MTSEQQKGRKKQKRNSQFRIAFYVLLFGFVLWGTYYFLGPTISSVLAGASALLGFSFGKNHAKLMQENKAKRVQENEMAKRLKDDIARTNGQINEGKQNLTNSMQNHERLFITHDKEMKQMDDELKGLLQAEAAKKITDEEALSYLLSKSKKRSAEESTEEGAEESGEEQV